MDFDEAEDDEGPDELTGKGKQRDEGEERAADLGWDGLRHVRLASRHYDADGDATDALACQKGAPSTVRPAGVLRGEADGG